MTSDNRTPRVAAVRRTAVVFFTVVWGLALVGCNHPLAQRSAWEWDSQLVLPPIDDLTDMSPRMTTTPRDGFYVLAREWRPRGPITADAAGPGEVVQTYLEAGEALGFRPRGDGRWVAVEGGREVVLDLAGGVHHVWYREKPDIWRENQTFWLVVLAGVTVAGLVVLIANADEIDIDFDS
ncbi:MAG: hypothetical protein AAF800_08470 [Planctomycetota bacterium]